MIHTTLPIGIWGMGMTDAAVSVGDGFVTTTADPETAEDFYIPTAERPDFLFQTVWAGDGSVVGRLPKKRLVYEAAKRRRQTSSGGPAAVFSLAQAVEQTAEEILAAALAFHQEAAVGGGQRRGILRRDREAVDDVRRFHLQIVFLLRQSDSDFPDTAKLDLLRLLHGEDPKAKDYLERFLTQREGALTAEDLPAIRREVERIVQNGLPDPIDLTKEMEKQGEGGWPASRDFFRRWAAGEIKVAVLPVSHLPTLTPEAFVSLPPGEEISERILPPPLVPLFREMSRRMGMTFREVFASYFFAKDLADAAAIINAGREHLNNLTEYAARLGRALAELSFPHSVEVLSASVPVGIHPEVVRSLRKQMPHQMLALQRGDVEPFCRYVSDLAERDAPTRSEDLFLVAAVLSAADTSEKPRLDFYVLDRDRERLEGQIAKVEWKGPCAIHPFLPVPEAITNVPQAGLPKYFITAIASADAEIRRQILQSILDRSEEAGPRPVDRLPSEAVEQTRTVYRYPQHSIQQGIRSMRGQMDAEIRKGLSPLDPVVQNTLLLFRLLENRALPLDARTAVCELAAENVGSQKLVFVKALLERYRAEEAELRAGHPEKVRDFSREVLAGYLLQIPWAWEIMVEEGLRRSGPVGGLRNHPPLGLEEIEPEDRPAAWRFAYAAQLLGISEAQVRSILAAVAQLPWGTDTVLRHRRFERLAGLAFPLDRGAFRFLENYRPGQDPGGPKMSAFLARVAQRDEEEKQWRLRTLVARVQEVYPRSVLEAEEALAAALAEWTEEDSADLWDLKETIPLLTYHLRAELGEEAAVAALKNIAMTARGFGRLRTKEVQNGEDPLTRVIRELTGPAHFAAALRDLARGLKHPAWGKPLRELLAKKAGNLHVIQYLLVALHLQRRLNQPEGRLVELLKREQRLDEEENAHGKIVNDVFLKYALFAVYGFHLAVKEFAYETELRLARHFASRNDIAQVEVIPETWLDPAVDLRIHPREGEPFLVEVKTLYFEHGDFRSLIPRFVESVAKASRQLGAQRRRVGDANGDDKIWVVIQIPNGRCLSEEEKKSLRRLARREIKRRNKPFVGEIVIEQRG